MTELLAGPCAAAAEWLLSRFDGGPVPTAEEIRENFTQMAVRLGAVRRATTYFEHTRSLHAASVEHSQATPNEFWIRISADAGSPPRWRLRVFVSPDGKIANMTVPSDAEEAGYSVVSKPLRQRTDEESAGIKALFDVAFDNPGTRYLEEALDTLRNVAIAWAPDGTMAGFALGDWRTIDLPGLEGQTLRIAGLTAVHPDHRRRHLFGELGSKAINRPHYQEGQRDLVCSRLTSEVAYRNYNEQAGFLPSPSAPPSPWQQEVAIAIVELLGERRQLDVRTFKLCGEPTVGAPRDSVTNGSWTAPVSVGGEQVKVPIDPRQGDALFTLFWMPDAPPGWS